MVIQKQNHANEHMGVRMSKSPSWYLLSYMVREELSKAPVILRVSLCYLLSLNMLVKLHLLFFPFRTMVEISKT